MIKALQLIFAPFNAWMRIAEAQRGVLFILCLFLLPLLLVCIGAESYALMRWGERRGEFGLVANVTQEAALHYGIAQAGTLLAAVFVGAFFVQAIANSFNMPTAFSQAFALMAYGVSPVVLLHLLDALPAAPTWVCWGVGAALSVSVLYHGVALVLKPEQTKGFGLYLVAAFVMVAATGVAHFISVAVLHRNLLQAAL